MNIICYVTAEELIKFRTASQIDIHAFMLATRSRINEAQVELSLDIGYSRNMGEYSVTLVQPQHIKIELAKSAALVDAKESDAVDIDGDGKPDTGVHLEEPIRKVVVSGEQ